MKKQLLFIFTALCSITSMAQVPNYVPTSGLVAWYSFTGNANDGSGNNYNGTVNGATLTTDRFGNTNSAYSFVPNGTSIENITTNYSGITGQSDRTISLWFNQYIVDNTTDIKDLCDYGTLASGQTFNPSIYQNRVGVAINVSDIYYSPNTFGNWHNYVVVYTASYGTNVTSPKVYLDGTLLTTSYLSSNTSVTLNTNVGFNFTIGGKNIVNQFNGKIDDIGIWNRVLTQQEITALYQTCTNSITTQPANQTANVNTTAQFYVTSTNTSATYQWQQNSGTGFANLSNFGQFSGVTNDTLKISNVTLAQNNYGYRCIVSGGCPDTSNVAMLNINNNVGVIEINNTNNVSISPNPFTSQTMITFSNEQKNTSVKIIDVVGKEIKQQLFSGKQLIIEKGELNNGIYFVQITDENRNTIINKIVIE